MTVVEACVAKKMINPPDDPLQFDSLVLTLLHEGIAQNSTGNVFVAKVNFHIQFAIQNGGGNAFLLYNFCLS